MSSTQSKAKLSDWELVKAISNAKHDEAAANRKLAEARRNDSGYKDGRDIMGANHQHEMAIIRLRELISDKVSREAVGDFNPKMPDNVGVKILERPALKEIRTPSGRSRVSTVDEKHAMFFELSSMLPKKR